MQSKVHFNSANELVLSFAIPDGALARLTAHKALELAINRVELEAALQSALADNGLTDFQKKYLLTVLGNKH